MSATSVTLRGRAAAERLMVDACVIKRLTGSSTDNDTSIITPTFTTLYTGKCKVQQGSAAASPSTVGEAVILTDQLTLHIPAAQTGVTTDDIATVTASALDPDLVGRSFRLTGLAHKSFLTARRFTMDEHSS
jgi:hypothetical protein